MRVLFVILALALPSIAFAGKTVGVLVSGEYLKVPTTDQTEVWLNGHAQTAVKNPLPADAVKTLADCFVLDDPKCAKSVIDARATAESVISIRVEVTSKKDKDVRLTIDWFVKGHNPVSARRTCESCTEGVLRSTLESMLADLSKTVPGYAGRINVTSNPAGITVLLDGATIGVTPIERDVPIGQHRVRLVRDGHMGDEKFVVVGSNAPTAIDLAPPTPRQALADKPPSQASRSRVLPGLMIGIGLGAIGVGTVLYLTDEDPDPSGMTQTYNDTENLGIGVAAGGAALALTGVIIIVATGGSSSPTVAMTSGGVSVGWAGRF